MIRLTEVTENNWFEVADLSVKDSQKSYVAPVIGILARGYVYRDCNARIYVIEHDGTIVGVSLVREFTDEPLGYDLQQFMIDQHYQGKVITIEVDQIDFLHRKADFARITDRIDANLFGLFSQT